jgi:5-methylcytosine-specific restriction enzyme A
MKISEIRIGMEINNGELAETFKCSTQGGMRKSNRTNTLTIISNRVKSVYNDRWVENILHYTGMGLKGDQRLDFSQNKTLANSLSNDIEVHLFEVLIDKIYTYKGQVTLESDPYIETQLDENNDKRKVWVFPLKIINDIQTITDIKILDSILKKKERNARRLSDERIEGLAKSGSGKINNRKVTTNYYERNVYVSEFAQRKAAGICQLCKKAAPFHRKDNSPFLESHHIVWLSKGGEDTIENVVAVCPNCHRKLHILNKQKDIEKLSNVNL